MFDRSAPIFHFVTWADVVINIGLSFILGVFVATIYRATQKGFKYSISLMHTLVYLTMIVSFVMMVIGSDIARAFSLVGALSVIRFRTAIKDTKDISFVFWALAAGMAAGVGYYQVSIVGTVLIGIFVSIVHYSRMGLLRRKEILLKFAVTAESRRTTLPYKEIFEKYLVKYNLLNIRTFQQGEQLELSFLIKMKDEKELQEFSRQLSSIPVLNRVSLIICEDDEWAENVI